MRQVVKDEELLKSVTRQMQGNSKDENEGLNKEIQQLRKNDDQITKRLANLVEQLSANAKLKESETITNAISDLEEQRFELRDLIVRKKRRWKE
ncbi:MAG TPA: hypothetical protein VMF88_00940 [Bacteroidota bacterium]|nr:hypothetical protein [Bacteroidota bacterium]